MNVGIICFSATGKQTAERIRAAFTEAYGETCAVTVTCKGKFTTDAFAGSLCDWTAARFADSSALIFVGSCGIAVRAIAPLLTSKTEDPAVLVVDELGIHCISLLSGHLGGANALCRRLAAAIEAAPVITTATDLHGKLSPDVFAKENDCVIDDMAAAKTVAAAILAGEAVTLYCDMPLAGVPEGITIKPLAALPQADPAAYGIVLSPYRRDLKQGSETGDRRLYLIPRWFYLGIGCRRGIGETQVAAAVEATLAAQDLDLRCIAGVASVDLKAEEQGLLNFCRQAGLPVTFLSGAQLAAVQGTFTESAFVQQVTGVGNVCERSAVALARQAMAQTGEDGAAELIAPKQCCNGVTTAIATGKRRITVE